MKKGSLLHSELSCLVARLGHTDEITIGDAGLPIPFAVPRIDLALTHNIPSFLQVLETLTSEIQVEKAILATEIKTINPDLYQAIRQHLISLEKQQKNKIEIVSISHEAFKEQSQKSRAVVRSGECSPYANIILCAGVTF